MKHEKGTVPGCDHCLRLLTIMHYAFIF
jgi:hypothetical protein